MVGIHGSLLGQRRRDDRIESFTGAQVDKVHTPYLVLHFIVVGHVVDC